MINVKEEGLEIGFSAYSLGFIQERHYKKLEQIDADFYENKEDRAFQLLFDENLFN